MFVEEQFFILGNPIETELGKVTFIKVYEYPQYYQDLMLMSYSKHKIIYNLTEAGMSDVAEAIQSLDLFDIVFGVMPDLLQSYARIFHRVLDDEMAISKVTKETFPIYRELILKMSCMKEEKVNPNPEIQRWIEKSRRLKQGNEKLTFADIVSSVAAFSGRTFKEINEMTLYQLYDQFNRIGVIKNYDTSTLFATVSQDVDIKSWASHIDLFEEEDTGISRDEFMKKSNEIFKNGS